MSDKPTAIDLLRLQKMEGRIAPVTKAEEQVAIEALKLKAVVEHPVGVEVWLSRDHGIRVWKESFCPDDETMTVNEAFAALYEEASDE